ncbi:MAG TPA: anhydro-N-acetylmuramic acid kinase [Chitinophagales bacterium]|nr:anhydro-N-acetylmuramic acid kinase [Chitinophagales bacterium]HMX03768.1 anhydro-N-acetylmuramic acid kinase [Chitinophagales bacterium]HMZ87918.1 anhydro-N-acetylmuramic acid kinase [Chitinophagales bacterium]HNA56971.1 anhydro-N-acetylmuramic acid kinase [Chitinophagales bacterium]HNE45801.1 anhydro-N-acetylmuramic acid kinase [Chitinophagales bacterium]
MSPERKTYTAIGVMSGSSLDGVDIALCEIKLEAQSSFEIIAAETYKYANQEISYIKSLLPVITDDHHAAHTFFAEIFARHITQFLKLFPDRQIDFIALHGHTLLHFPAQGVSLQLGDPQLMANILGIPVIAHFRQADIDAGGQGAPLVPMCDVIFFKQYDACLNLGGIANISFESASGRIGFDVCACNQLLNYCAAMAGLDYDPEGELAAAGMIDQDLLDQLNAVPYLDMPWPKSLDNHFVHRAFIDTIAKSTIPLNDKLATAVEHIAIAIAAVIIAQPERRPLHQYQLLVTGGGAYNTFLIERIAANAGIKITLPGDKIIQYKEALAMALMGALRIQSKPNFLQSVTGAKTAVSGGVIAYPEKIIAPLPS